MSDLSPVERIKAESRGLRGTQILAQRGHAQDTPTVGHYLAVLQGRARVEHLQVVAGGDPRQRLHRPEGIVGKDAAQVLNVGAAEHLLRRRPRVGSPEPFGADRDLLGVDGAAGQRDPDVDGCPSDDRHQPLCH